MAPHFNFTAHEGDKFSRNGKSEPGSAIAPGCRLICLDEGIEQFRQRLRRNSNTGVFDFEADFCPCVGGVDEPGAENHTSIRRELDRIGQQIQQDLSQAHGIADQRLWKIFIDHDRKGQLPLFDLQRHDLREVRNGLAKTERRALYLQRGRAELGQVQHIIDDVEQRLAGDLDAIDKPVLLRRQFGARQQVGQANHGIERRPDFMAHVRDEHALGATGALRVFGGLVQALFARLVGFFIERGVPPLRRALTVRSRRAGARDRPLVPISPR